MRELTFYCLDEARHENVFDVQDIRRIYDLFQLVCGREDQCVDWDPRVMRMVNGKKVCSKESCSKSMEEHGATLRQVKDCVPVLKHNPFLPRIMQIFTKERNTNWNPVRSIILFKEFLLMALVFAPETSGEVKMDWAFQLYAIRNKDLITSDDMVNALDIIFHDSCFEDSSMKQALVNLGADWMSLKLRIVKNVLNEADLDMSRALSIVEFRHLMRRIPQFLHHFKFVL